MKNTNVKRILDVIAQWLMILILLSPVVGLLGIFPAPTADLYYTQEAFDFIMVLMNVGYINVLLGIFSALAIFLIVTRRMALAALIIFPMSINIFMFHAVLDNGIFTTGALMGNVLFLLNLYFLWKHRDDYRPLFKKKSRAVKQ